MKTVMSVVKKRGVYTARKRVPPHLQEAVGRVSLPPRGRVAWLQKSLRTKDLKHANVAAKAILMEFDRIIAAAEASTIKQPVRSQLSDKEIASIAAYHYARALSDDEAIRTKGLGFREFPNHVESIEEVLNVARESLAAGDVPVISDFLDDLLSMFRINLDRNSLAYRKLGMAVLTKEVEALTALAERNKGVPVASPEIEPLMPQASSQTNGDTLKAALAGWKKARKPSPRSIQEFDLGVGRFVELHGDMPVREIRRSHVRAFREALQEIPKRRTGTLRSASFPELIKWAKAHPAAEGISAATVNKSLGAVQAVGIWARDNGIIPDDVPWSDPVANMRLEEALPEREPWEATELNMLFASPVYSQGKRPQAGGGEAAYWLPLLGLYTGARLGELGPLRTSDIETDATTGIVTMSITEDAEQDKRLKTTSSKRIVPIHPELVRLGFLDYVKKRIDRDGKDVRLFPMLKPGPAGGVAEGWSKWFGRYIRALGIDESVFHGFRHSFKDAVRASGAGEDVNDALTGHSSASVGRSYGAKDAVRRFGLKRLADVVAGVRYEGLKPPTPSLP